MTEPTLLDECAISKIEARIAKRDDTSALESACGEYNCSCHYDLPALCATVKHLRELADTRSDLIAAKAAHVDQLQSQLEQLWAENERLRELVRHMQFPRGG